MAKKIESRGALDIARRAWQTCGQVFEFALAHGLVERNPSRDVRPGAALKPRKQTHYARIEPAQLPELLRKLHAYPGSPYTRYALQLMALTFVRTGELIAARWDEFDLEGAEWRIPADRMKMKTPHIVPLAHRAVDALRCLHELKGLSGLLFPGERDQRSVQLRDLPAAAAKNDAVVRRSPGPTAAGGEGDSVQGRMNEPDPVASTALRTVPAA